jgi:hypothetical protein
MPIILSGMCNNLKVQNATTSGKTFVGALNVTAARLPKTAMSLVPERPSKVNALHIKA